MGFMRGVIFAIACLVVLLPSLTQGKFTLSRASFYGDGEGTSTGACGFGDTGSTINNGYVATVSNRLFKYGQGCGACYQVSCNNRRYCSATGVNVVATDNGEGDRTDFILNKDAFLQLATDRDAGQQLVKLGTIDVQYQRVSCPYAVGSNVQVKITEQARNPDYLSLVFLYVGGIPDIIAVEVLEDWNSWSWRPLRRVYGAVWDTPNPPAGDLYLRFQVSGSQSRYYVSLIPSEWTPGSMYDAGFQLP